MLVDARHLPSEDDLGMLEYARYYEIPVCIVATKTDKVQASQPCFSRCITDISKFFTTGDRIDKT